MSAFSFSFDRIEKKMKENNNVNNQAKATYTSDSSDSESETGDQDQDQDQDGDGDEDQDQDQDQNQNQDQKQEQEQDGDEDGDGDGDGDEAETEKKRRNNKSQISKPQKTALGFAVKVIRSLGGQGQEKVIARDLVNHADLQNALQSIYQKDQQPIDEIKKAITAHLEKHLYGALCLGFRSIISYSAPTSDFILRVDELTNPDDSIRYYESIALKRKEILDKEKEELKKRKRDDKVKDKDKPNKKSSSSSSSGGGRITLATLKKGLNAGLIRSEFYDSLMKQLGK
jgi:hypothetical protein